MRGTKNVFKGRAWELDFARGVAVALMAAFHAVFDLNVYFNVDISYTSGFWYYAGKLSAILFMFISGISSRFSNRLIKRGVIVFGCGMVVTATSIPIMGENYIRFGILHFFGAAMVLNGLLNLTVDNPKIKNAVFAFLIPVSAVLGRIFRTIPASTPLLLPFGIMPDGFSSFDYYPLFPWLAFYCTGALAGYVLYKEKGSIITYDPTRGKDGITANALDSSICAVCFLGRNSLVIYLIHQPLILGVLYILFSIPKTFS